MLTIYKRGRVWWLRGTVAGRRLHESTRTADAGIAEQVRIRREAAEWHRHLHGPQAVLTFAQAASLYLDAQKPPRFLAPIVAWWKDTRVADITAGAIRQSAVTLYPDAGAATRNRQVIVPTRAVINHAAAMDLCPFIRVARFREQKTHRPPIDRAWLDAFAAHAPDRLAALAWFLYLTGSRITPAVRLRWADVDLARARAVLRKPKGRDDQIVHLQPMMVAMLAGLPGGRQPFDKVFGFASRHSVYGPWKTAIRRAGIAPITPHGGRHGFATDLLRAGLDPKTVAALGHWKSARLVLETYAHAIEDRTLTDRLAAPPAHHKSAKALK